MNWLDRKKYKGKWIGVDLDGVLVEYHAWNNGKLGKPIPRMCERVAGWLQAGIEVRILTSRVGKVYPEQVATNVTQIRAFCYEQFKRILPITNEKDQNMIELWDDRAIQVVSNKGVTLTEYWNCKDLD